MADALHPALSEIAALLNAERGHLVAVWASIPPADRERRPTPGEWTPAEVMEHLRLTEGGSARLLARRLERARDAGLGREEDAASRVGTLRADDLVRATERFEAPEPVRPAADVPAAGVEAGLAQTRAVLDGLMADASGAALGGVRAMHPRFGDLDMYQWLEFIALHERRHARQLARLRDALAAAPGGGSAAQPTLSS